MTALVKFVTRNDNQTMRLIHIQLLIIIALTGCHSSTSIQTSKQVNVSILPQKYLVDKISGGKYQVNVMVISGNNHETYEPTPQQMVLMEQAPLYLQLCKDGFDQIWIDNIKSRTPQMLVADLSEGLKLISGETECNHKGHNHAMSVDPHVWISPSTMKIIALNTFKAMMEQFPADSVTFINGYALLEKEIIAIDNAFSTQLGPFKGSQFMVYHPVLSYLARDYGLTELSIETEGKEPSVESLKRLIEQARQNHIKVIFVQQEYDTRNAEIIANETGSKIVQFNPMGYNWPQQTADLLQYLTQNLSKQ